jgi:beta-fructofuranosidase
VTDHLFPRYHVRPPTGYLNDPNGPVLIDGRTHLYFQHRDDVEHGLQPDWGPVHWGHVSSGDLVHWDYYPPAVLPHPGLGDQNGCWSGNIVVDPGGAIRAFYSGHVDGEQLQRTLSATSTDGGNRFSEPRQVIAAPTEDEHIMAMRDPFVWCEGSSWRMVLGAGTDFQTAMLRLYSSDDLENWEFRGPWAHLERVRTAHWDSGAMWECPQILPFDGTTIAVVGSWAPGEGVMDVLSFVTPPEAPAGIRIEPSSLHRVDHGPNFYAASVMTEGFDQPIMWGWLTEARSHDWCLADQWSGMLSLPRLMQPGTGGVLHSSPVPQMSRLRLSQAGQAVDDVMEGLGAQFEFALEGLPTVSGVHTVRMRFGPEEHLDVVVDVDAARITVDRRQASRDERATGGEFPIEAPDLTAPDTTTLRGFVDGSVLELFLPGGKVATTRFYPTTPPPWTIELDGPGNSLHLQVWALNPGHS